MADWLTLVEIKKRLNDQGIEISDRSLARYRDDFISTFGGWITGNGKKRRYRTKCVEVFRLVADLKTQGKDRQAIQDQLDQAFGMEIGSNIGEQAADRQAADLESQSIATIENMGLPMVPILEVIGRLANVAENQQNLYEQQSEMIRQMATGGIGEKQLSQSPQVGQEATLPTPENKPAAGPPASIEDRANEFNTKLVELAAVFPGMGDIAERIQFNHTDDQISLVYSGEQTEEIGTWGSVDTAKYTLKKLIRLLDVILIHTRDNG